MILTALPQILAVVKAVEEAVGAGNGKSKKALVMDAIAAGSKAGESIPIKQVATVSAVIDSIVSTFNASGVFNKVTPTPTPAT